MADTNQDHGEKPTEPEEKAAEPEKKDAATQTEPSPWEFLVPFDNLTLSQKLDLSLAMGYAAEVTLAYRRSLKADASAQTGISTWRREQTTQTEPPERPAAECQTDIAGLPEWDKVRKVSAKRRAAETRHAAHERLKVAAVERKRTQPQKPGIVMITPPITPPLSCNSPCTNVKNKGRKPTQ